MADDASYTDDISALWGPEREAGLSPARPAATNGAGSEATEPAVVDGNGNGHGNGNGIGSYPTADEQDRRNEVARLAEAIATTHVDVVRRNDLDALRSELEGTFTHQLAVALYELMSASNARLSRAEDHIDQRVEEAVERQTIRLAASLDAHHEAAREMTDMIWREIDSLRQRFVGPIDGLTGFQRELRHEVGRLSDLVSDHGRQFAERAGVEAQRRERNDDRMVQAAGDLGDISEAVAAMKDDLGALRAEVAELRAAVGGAEQPGRKPRWRGRNR